MAPFGLNSISCYASGNHSLTMVDHPVFSFLPAWLSNVTTTMILESIAYCMGPKPVWKRIIIFISWEDIYYSSYQNLTLKKFYIICLLQIVHTMFFFYWSPVCGKTFCGLRCFYLFWIFKSQMLFISNFILIETCYLKQTLYFSIFLSTCCTMEKKSKVLAFRKYLMKEIVPVRISNATSKWLWLYCVESM